MTGLIQPISEECKKIFYIEGQANGQYPFSHSMLINDCLIDTGVSTAYLRKLKRKYQINNVLLSHWHADHIAGNRIFPEAKFFAHPEDIPIIENVKKMYEHYFPGDPEQKELIDQMFGGYRLKNREINNEIRDKDIIEIGDDYKIKVIHTPGHTKGHCCFFEVNSKIMFLATFDLSSFGPWYAGRDSNPIDFEESIQKLKGFEIDIAVTSHSGIIEGRSSILDGLISYENIIHKRDEKILSNLSDSKPINAEDLRKKNLIYEYYTEHEIYEMRYEVIMIQKHLDKLETTGMIKKQDYGYVLK